MRRKDGYNSSFSQRLPTFLKASRSARSPREMFCAAAVTARKLLRSSSRFSLTKAFLPGNFSSSASKLPLANSATQVMAFFLTLMWPLTMSLTPLAMTR